MARVTADGQSLNLEQGMSKVITEKGMLTVENTGDQAIYLIQVRLKAGKRGGWEAGKVEATGSSK
jgi:hypothetical protein